MEKRHLDYNPCEIYSRAFSVYALSVACKSGVGCAFQNWERQKESDHPLTEESAANDADADLLKLSPGPRR